MDLRTHRRTLTLARLIYEHKKNVISRIEAHPQKPACRDDFQVDQPFPRTSPEIQGFTSSHIDAFIEALQNDASLDLHSVMIIRNGSVIAEADFGAYDHRLWHITHSECKSITGLAIGMLIDDGKLSLDDRLLDLFAKQKIPLSLLTHKNMTVQHLLTMSSGAVFNELGAITETNWIKSFMETTVITEPGKLFNYNSMNTYMLSAIVHEISGLGLTNFLQERLWKPLGISNIFWETCPRGIEKGGWGLYIQPEDLAKIGQLIMQKGRWHDQQLVSEHWIEEMLTAKMSTIQSLCEYDYGYQIWVGRTRNSFLMNGLFGQNVIGFPDDGLLILSNAGNNELFQQSNFYVHIDNYFSEDLCKKQNANSIAVSRVKNSWLPSLAVERLGNHEEVLAALHGKIFKTDPTESIAVGLLPFITQLLQNNFTQGLISIGFEFIEGEFYLTVTETDESYRLPVGFDTPRTADLSFHGEPYRVGVSGRLTSDEDDNPVLKLRISFLEIANSRLIKIHIYGNTIIIKLTESPGVQFFANAVDGFKSELKSYSFIDNLIGIFENSHVSEKFKHILEPQVSARLMERTTNNEQLRNIHPVN